MFYIVPRQARREALAIGEDVSDASFAPLAWAAVQKITEIAVAAPQSLPECKLAWKLRSRHADYEDNLVVAAAETCGADYVVTFDQAFISHYTPVCIMDTGFDATHPDLVNMLYRFTPEQQQKYGCGEYGYNASGDQLGTDFLRPSGEHGSHVAKITTSDVLIMRVVFSQSNEGRSSENGTLPLYENTYTTPISASGYEKEDRLYAPMVGCSGYIFAQTSKVTSMAAQGFWRYDIEKDSWEKTDIKMPSECALVVMNDDKDAAKLTDEDLTSAIAATGLKVEASKELAASKVHAGFAGLPNGVAIVGNALKDDRSYELGRDTHIIYDDANEAVEFDHTASYHRSYDPMATYYDGKLYAAAQCTAEPDAMYFRSTQIVKPATYAFVSGDGSSWTKGSADALTFTVKRSEADDQTFGRFVGVDVDGTAVDAENFEAKAGSLVLSLKPAYLQTLEAQEHTIETKFDDGTATATFTVANATTPGADSTNGDSGGSGTQGATQAATDTTGTTGKTTLAKTADETVSPVGFAFAAIAALVGAAYLRRKHEA